MVAPNIRTPSILVCEDDAAMVRIFQFLLRQRGIAVKTTSRGDTVTKMALRDKPDAIVLDLMLPDMDGISVLKALKAQKETQSIPVIIVSAKEASDQINQALKAGAVDYVTKPFDPSQLGKRLRDFLDNMHHPMTPQTGPAQNGHTPGMAAGGAH